jgi:uncharacterized membrane protein YkoI
MNENAHTPESTDHIPATPATNDVVVTEKPQRSRTRTLLFAGGAIVAAAVLVGGGAAIGAAIADDDDDDVADASLVANDEAGDSTTQTDRDDDDDTTTGVDDDTSSSSGTTAGSEVGTSSAAELNEIIAAASAIADGDPVSIDAERGGAWDVSFETAAGDESEVRVSSDGTAKLISTEAADADDTAPQGTLDAKTVDALVAAALAEVDGAVTDLDIDDDPTSPFDVSVLTSDGRSVDIELDAQMSVLSVEND